MPVMKLDHPAKLSSVGRANVSVLTKVFSLKELIATHTTGRTQTMQIMVKTMVRIFL